MSSPSSPPPTLRGPPVLVVDDEAAIRHVLRLLLEREGYAAIEAADGAEALARLAADPAPRLAFCDLRMPVLDGHGFLAQARAAHPTLRVVMMSAYGGQEEAVAALARGAWAYINKPVRPDELRHVLRGIAEQERYAIEPTLVGV
jgi:two-component system response regulator AtoC